MSAKANVEIILSDGKKAGDTLKELQKTANLLNKEIKNLKPGSEDFINKTADFQKVTGRLKDVRSEVTGVNKESKNLLGSFKQFLPFSGQLDAISGKMSIFKGSVGGVSKGFGVLKTAIWATGIGLLIGLITTLVGWFSKTQRGIEAVSKITSALSAAFNVLIDRGFKVIDALKSFVTFKFSDGVDKLKESVHGLTDEIVNETTKAYQLKQALFEIQKQEDDLILKRAISRSQIKELNKIAEDTTKGYKERSDAARQAISIEQSLLTEQIENQKKRAANILGLFELTDEKLADIKKNGLKLEDVGLSESTEADRKKALEEIAKIFELQESSLELQTTLQNKLNTINQQRDADDKRRIAEKKKREDDLQKFLADKQAEEIADRKATDAEIEKLGKEEADALQKEFEEVNKSREDYYNSQLDLLDVNNENKKLKIEEDNANKLISEKEMQDQLLQLERERLENQLKLLTEFYGKDSIQVQQAEIALRQKNIEIKKRETDEFVANEERKKVSLQTTLAAGKDVTGAFIDLLGQDEEARRKHAQEIKAFEAAQVVINGINEVSGIFASTAGWGPAGWILAGVKTAVAIARTAAAVAQINAQKFSLGGLIRYGAGGVLKGPRHSNGGIPGVIRSTGQPIEMEGGEIILTRAVGQSDYGRMIASNLNTAFGGRSFFQFGGPINPLGSASSISSQVPSSAGAIAGDAGRQFDQLVQEMRSLRKDVLTWPKTLQVHNNVQDTMTGINVINNLKRRADF